MNPLLCAIIFIFLSINHADPFFIFGNNGTIYVISFFKGNPPPPWVWYWIEEARI